MSCLFLFLVFLMLSLHSFIHSFTHLWGYIPGLIYFLSLIRFCLYLKGIDYILLLL